MDGNHGGIKLDSYYTNHMDKGLSYQDFVVDQLYNIGIVVITYSSTEYQKRKGESRNGVEIKFDDKLAITGNIYIETQEKSHSSNSEYVPSGIYRNDNSWLYTIGNYELILIFAKSHLQRVFENGKYPEIEIVHKTSKGFLLPLDSAKRIAIKCIEIQKDLFK